MANILVIEDVEDVREAIVEVLQSAGHTVTQADNGEEGLSAVKFARFDLVITDILMPEKDGTEVIIALTEQKERPPILAISGGGSKMSAYIALHMARLKADATLAKPFNNADLLATVQKLLQNKVAS
ncbi:Response regulator receiver domain-containing protein [Azospirillaceae bacterium]